MCVASMCSDDTVGCSATAETCTAHYPSKRHKTEEMPIGAAQNSNPSHACCDFYLTGKRRFCRSHKKPGHHFCFTHAMSEHHIRTTDKACDEAAAAANAHLSRSCSSHASETGIEEIASRRAVDERVPCPINPHHTVYASRLSKHVRVCPDLRFVPDALPYYVKDKHANKSAHSLPPGTIGAQSTSTMCASPSLPATSDDTLQAPASAWVQHDTDTIEQHTHENLSQPKAPAAPSERRTHRDLTWSQRASLIQRIEAVYQRYIAPVMMTTHRELTQALHRDTHAGRSHETANTNATVYPAAVCAGAARSHKHSPQHDVLIQCVSTALLRFQQAHRLPVMMHTPLASAHAVVQHTEPVGYATGVEQGGGCALDADAHVRVSACHFPCASEDDEAKVSDWRIPAVHGFVELGAGKAGLMLALQHELTRRMNKASAAVTREKLGHEGKRCEPLGKEGDCNPSDKPSETFNGSNHIHEEGESIHVQDVCANDMVDDDLNWPLTDGVRAQPPTLVVVDYDGFRRKGDARVRQSALPLHRLRVNIKDLDLVKAWASLTHGQGRPLLGQRRAWPASVSASSPATHDRRADTHTDTSDPSTPCDAPTMRGVQNVVVMGKHLCGACTDFSLACMTDSARCRSESSSSDGVSCAASCTRAKTTRPIAVGAPDLFVSAAASSALHQGDDSVHTRDGHAEVRVCVCVLATCCHHRCELRHMNPVHNAHTHVTAAVTPCTAGAKSTRSDACPALVRREEAVSCHSDSRNNHRVHAACCAEQGNDVRSGASHHACPRPSPCDSCDVSHLHDSKPCARRDAQATEMNTHTGTCRADEVQKADSQNGIPVLRLPGTDFTLTPDEFAAMTSMSSWAVSGPVVSDAQRWTGRCCKRVLDAFRLAYLQCCGYDGVLCEYASVDVTDENVCIVAWQRAPQAKPGLSADC